MSKRTPLLLIVVSTLLCPVTVTADYTLILKNGRRITAKNYREEGSMIKIQGLGGELGIPKDQIQTIVKSGEAEPQGLNIPELEASSRQAPAPPQKPSVVRGEPEKTKAPAYAAEEKAYQKRLAEVTRDLEEARQRYFQATQGGDTASRATKEGYKALTADLMSRLKDRRGASPEEYEPQEKELSDLRKRIDDLQKERDALIEEMKSKNIPITAF